MEVLRIGESYKLHIRKTKRMKWTEFDEFYHKEVKWAKSTNVYDILNAYSGENETI